MSPPPAAVTEMRGAGHRVSIVTARHLRCSGDTVDWLQRHGIRADDVRFEWDKPRAGCDVYLDDAPHNIVALRQAGASAVTDDATYNQDVTRASGGVGGGVRRPGTLRAVRSAQWAPATTILMMHPMAAEPEIVQARLTAEAVLAREYDDFYGAGAQAPMGALSAYGADVAAKTMVANS